MADIDGNISPPGTRLSPRRNLGVGERGLSLAAGTLLGGLAGRQRGGAGLLLGLAGSMLVARGLTGASPTRRLLGQRPDEAEAAREAGWKSAALSCCVFLSTLLFPRYSSSMFSRMRGLPTKARAMAMRWRCPPDKPAPCSPTIES